MVERARDYAKVVTGGAAPTGDLARGCYYEPTLVSDVPLDSEIWRDEVFGPVLVVVPFDDDDEAIRLANDTAVRPRRLGLDPRHLPRRPRHPRDQGRLRVGQRPHPDHQRDAARRVPAQRLRQGHVGLLASTSTPTSSTSCTTTPRWRTSRGTARSSPFPADAGASAGTRRRRHERHTRTDEQPICRRDPPSRSTDAERGAQVARDDRAHVFHSWSAQALINPLPIAGASGSHFWDFEGTRYLDFSSQLVNVNIGYQHPKLVAAIQEAAARQCTIAPSFADESRSEAARLIAERGPRRPRQGLLHQRRRRGHRERHADGAPAHRPPEGARDLPQLPRRHRRVDHGDRRPAALAERAGDAGHRPLLGAVPLPLGLPRDERGRGVRARPPAPARHHRVRGPVDDRGGDPRDGRRHQRHPRAAGRLPRRASARSATSTASCGSPTRSWPASAGAASGSPSTTGASPPTSSASPRASTPATSRSAASSSRPRSPRPSSERAFPGGLTYSGHPLACASAVASIRIFEEEGILENVRKVSRHGDRAAPGRDRREAPERRRGARARLLLGARAGPRPRRPASRSSPTTPAGPAAGPMNELRRGVQGRGAVALRPLQPHPRRAAVHDDRRGDGRGPRHARPRARGRGPVHRLMAPSDDVWPKSPRHTCTIGCARGRVPVASCGCRRLAQRPAGARRHASRSSVYFTDRPENLYQIDQWFEPLRRLHERHHVTPSSLAQLGGHPRPAARLPRPGRTTAPNIDARRGVPRPAARSGRSSTSTRTRPNFSAMRFADPAHVFICHGESDKDYMSSNQLKAYDRVFIAGKAARERILRKLHRLRRVPARRGRPPPGRRRLPRPVDAPATAARWCCSRRHLGGRPCRRCATPRSASHGPALVRALVATGRHRVDLPAAPAHRPDRAARTRTAPTPRSSRCSREANRADPTRRPRRRPRGRVRLAARRLRRRGHGHLRRRLRLARHRQAAARHPTGRAAGGSCPSQGCVSEMELLRRRGCRARARGRGRRGPPPRRVTRGARAALLRRHDARGEHGALPRRRARRWSSEREAALAARGAVAGT